MTGLGVLFLDEYLVAVNKPSGMLSVPGRGEEKKDCAVSRMSAELGWIREVHRLDQATSGVLLLARNPEIHRRLCGAFANREVLKTYQAAVPALPEDPRLAGVLFCPGPEPGSGEVNLRQRKDMDRPPRQMVDPVLGREAVTRWRTTMDKTDLAGFILDLMPLTGRTHQLRLALAVCGAPIFGDGLYAPEAVRDAVPRLLLHAVSLSFRHPVSREETVITAGNLMSRGL